MGWVDSNDASNVSNAEGANTTKASDAKVTNTNSLLLRETISYSLYL